MSFPVLLFLNKLGSGPLAIEPDLPWLHVTRIASRPVPYHSNWFFSWFDVIWLGLVLGSDVSLLVWFRFSSTRSSLDTVGYRFSRYASWFEACSNQFGPRSMLDGPSWSQLAVSWFDLVLLSDPSKLARFRLFIARTRLCIRQMTFLLVQLTVLVCPNQFDYGSDEAAGTGQICKVINFNSIIVFFNILWPNFLIYIRS